MTTKKKEVTSHGGTAVQITAPRFERAEFEISGPILVAHRFSHKMKQKLLDDMKVGKASASRKNRAPKDTDALFEDARYRHKDGWDGFPASAVRKAMISACRLKGFKMTLAKLSIFAEADGWDAVEPQIPLVRIYGEPIKQADITRLPNGAPNVAVRAAYHDWRAKIRIRWDADQFTLQDIANLLATVGYQVGFGEGRPDSPNSAGMEWGLFEIERADQKVRKAAAG